MRPRLRLVFIGFNPGLESARAGHYYAFRGNVFWRQLNESGLIDPKEGAIGFEDDAALMDRAGIGFTDLCLRETARADQLRAEEFVEGAGRLHGELLTYQPEVAVFCGRGIFDRYARLALGVAGAQLRDREWGAQPERIGGTRVWVVPNSSGLASGLHGRRLELLKQLAREIGMP